MAIGITGVDSGSNATDATSYANFTVSRTPGTNLLQILVVKSRVASGTPNAPTVTGCNLTWNLIGTANNNPPAANHSVNFYYAIGSSPSAGQLTTDFAGQTQTHIIWSWSECTGINITTPVVSGSFTELGQNHSSGVDPFILTLPAFGSASNAAFGAVAGFTTVNLAPASDFTEIHDIPFTDGASTNSFQSQWKINDTTIDWNLDDANKNAIAGGFEIADVSFGGNAIRISRMTLLGAG